MVRPTILAAGRVRGHIRISSVSALSFAFSHILL